MKYSESEFLEVLDDFSEILPYIYYPKLKDKEAGKKLKKLKKQVKKNGINSILKESKVCL